MAGTANLLERLQSHIEALATDPATPLDERLFESSVLVLPQNVSKNESVSLVTQLSSVLPTLQNDPTPAINFLVVLLEPYPSSDIRALGQNVDYVAGLDVQAVPYNRLMLSLLRKASYNPGDAATIAAQPEIVSALIKLWLCTQDAGIGNDAGDVLLRLLNVDRADPNDPLDPPSAGQGLGLMWKRVFGDKDVYNLFFSICSFSNKNNDFQLSKSQRTLAQARLLEWLPKIGKLDWHAITKSHHRDLEMQYMPNPSTGLLDFAATVMVDVKDDVLMHRCLIDFFASILSAVTHREGVSSPGSSVSLDFLVHNGLHERSASLYLDPSNPAHDPLDLHFLTGASCNYVAAYASTYPANFLASDMRNSVIARLQQSLDLSPGRWAHQESPKYDLHLLASLPRIALFPQARTMDGWQKSPLSLLPSKATNPDVLRTLATIFHGPTKPEVTWPLPDAPEQESDSVFQTEAAAARVLYFTYLNYNPGLFGDLVTHAETIALKDHALAAINLITGIITADWRALPAESSTEAGALPTENEFVQSLPQPPTATPAAGVLAILAPPSLEYTLPYLLKPAKTFSNLVGGLGDTENAAYKVATAKFDALRALHDRLLEHAKNEPEEGFEDIIATLGNRIAQGPWNKQGEVGGHIATMEL